MIKGGVHEFSQRAKSSRNSCDIVMYLSCIQRKTYNYVSVGTCM